MKFLVDMNWIEPHGLLSSLNRLKSYPIPIHVHSRCRVLNIYVGKMSCLLFAKESLCIDKLLKQSSKQQMVEGRKRCKERCNLMKEGYFFNSPLMDLCFSRKMQCSGSTLLTQEVVWDAYQQTFEKTTNTEKRYLPGECKIII